MLRRVCSARSLLTELLVSDVEPLASDVEPLVSDVEPPVSDVEPPVSDVEPPVSDVEIMCRTSITSPLCPRLRRKDCVAQDRLLGEPRTVLEFMRCRALATLHWSSTACPGSPHHTHAPAAGLTSPLFSSTFTVYCSSSPFLQPCIRPLYYRTRRPTLMTLTVPSKMATSGPVQLTPYRTTTSNSTS